MNAVSAGLCTKSPCFVFARPGNAGYYVADYGWHVPSLLEACDALLDERGFRGSAKAGISVFDDDFGLHAQQVAPSACSTNAT